MIKRRKDEVSQWLQVLAFATIPLEPILINNICIILLALSTILNPNKERWAQYSVWAVAPFIAFFLIHLIGISYSPEPLMPRATRYMENKTSLLIFPLLLLFGQPVKIRKAIFCFAAVVCALCLVCLVTAIVKNFQYNSEYGAPQTSINPWFFTYFLYSDVVSIDPTYFSIFIVFSIVCLLGWREPEPIPYWKWVVVCFLGLNLLMLTSRTLIGATVLYFMIFLVMGLRVSPAKRVAYLAVAGVVVTVALMNPVVQLRIGDTFENNDSNFSGFSLRRQMWVALYNDLVTENWLLGIGSINQDETIRNVYKEHGIVSAYELNYNSHNQYLETTLHQGIFGLLSLLLLYGFYLKWGLNDRNYYLIVAVLIFAIISLTESIMVRQKGIVFFSCVIPLLAFNHPAARVSMGDGADHANLQRTGMA